MIIAITCPAGSSVVIVCQAMSNAKNVTCHFSFVNPPFSPFSMSRADNGRPPLFMAARACSLVVLALL